MVKKDKKTEDPYAEIRREIPPPGYGIGKGREYDKKKHRKRKKEVIRKELEEWEDELDDNIQIL